MSEYSSQHSPHKPHHLDFVALIAAKIQENPSNYTFDDLPSINLSDLTNVEATSLASLAKKGHAKVFLDKLEGPIDLEVLSDGEILLLEAFMEAGYTDELLAKFPDEIDLSRISDEVAIGLNKLIKFKEDFAKQLAEQLLAKIKAPIDLEEIEEDCFILLSTMVNQGHGEAVLAKLLTPIDLEHFSKAKDKFFLSLIRQKLSYLLVTKLPEFFDLEKMHELAGFFLASLVEIRVKEPNFWLEKLPASIDLAKLNDATGYLLFSIGAQGLAKELFTRLKGQIDLERLARGTNLLLSILVNLGYGEKILNKISTLSNIESIDINKIGDLVFALADNGYDQALREKLFADREQNLEETRTPLRLTEANLPESKIGLSMEEIFDFLPLNESSKVSRLGWEKYRLEKDPWRATEISGMEVWFKRDPEDLNNLKVIFRTSRFEKLNLGVYKAAIKVLPTGVSRAVYPELADPNNPNFDRFYSDGFREVFAGPSLNTIIVSRLPEALQHSIKKQKGMILLTLALNGINHRHPHDGNFNLRFLQIDEDGSKKLIFELDEALKLATDSTMTIIPIVTLRDWDMAIYY